MSDRISKAAAAYRAGANLAPDRAVGRRTWENFLAARVGSPSAAAAASAASSLPSSPIRS